MTRKYGLIGFPLTHSFSQGFFTEKFKKEELDGCSYHNFPMENLGGIRKLIEEEKELMGLNVTIPHKIQILQYLDKIDEISELIGSVNTIKIERKDSALLLTGFNTDYEGFQTALKPLLRSHHTRALILGNGGSSKAVQFALKKLGIDFLIVTRTPRSNQEISWSLLNENHVKFHPLIINTTPVGLYPEIEKLPPLPYDSITDQHLLFDLIYNPTETKFLSKGKDKGAMISNGLTMLHQQALASWRIWNA